MLSFRTEEVTAYDVIRRVLKENKCNKESYNKLSVEEKLELFSLLRSNIPLPEIHILHGEILNDDMFLYFAFNDFFEDKLPIVREDLSLAEIRELKYIGAGKIFYYRYNENEAELLALRKYFKEK